MKHNVLVDADDAPKIKVITPSRQAFTASTATLRTLYESDQQLNAKVKIQMEADRRLHRRWVSSDEQP